jgi:peptidoglycan/xylan/chitin deacetylase (PgdA/CDA1 family)
VLGELARTVRLRELVDMLGGGKPPDRAVVITFDDGYADNLHQAKPWLERFALPATAFLTAGRVGSRREFWWDELDRLLLQPGRLPSRLELGIDGRQLAWELGSASTYTEQDFQRERGWHIERPDDPGPRQRLFRDLFNRLLLLSDKERRSILDSLRTWAGAERSARSTHLPLSEEETCLLVGDGLIEVGAHTMTHPLLAEMTSERQRAEIRQSKECLERIANQPVTSFAYPSGSYSRETIAILRNLGFACACTSNPQAVWPGADRFEIPRLVVRDWDGETFGRWLKWWLDG